MRLKRAALRIQVLYENFRIIDEYVVQRDDLLATDVYLAKVLAASNDANGLSVWERECKRLLESADAEARAEGAHLQAALDIAAGKPLLGKGSILREGQIGAPHALSRSGLFRVASKKTAREQHSAESPLRLRAQGPGRWCLEYVGEELRMDDAALWLQLLAQARAVHCGQPLVVKPRQLQKTLGWNTSSDARKRLIYTLTRLQETSLKVYSEVLPLPPINMSLVSLFVVHDRLVSVYLPPQVRQLFSVERIWSWYEAETFHALPDGLAKWLVLFYGSHTIPKPMQVEELRDLCGSRSGVHEFGKLLKTAVPILKGAGVLSRYAFSAKGLSVSLAKAKAFEQTSDAPSAADFE